MNKIGSQYIIVLLIIFSVLLLAVQPVSATHSTCTSEADEYCGVTLDWQYIFSDIEGPNDGSLNSNSNTEYRRLYSGISTARNSDMYEALAGFSMPKKDDDNEGVFDYGGRFEDTIGFPEYRYEIHGWSSDGTVSMDDGETEQVFDGSQPVYEASWPTTDRDDDLNKFKADTIEGRMKIPENSSITIDIYKTDELDEVLDSIEFEYKPHYGDTERLRSKDVEISSDEYMPVYWLNMKMERDNTDIESPTLDRAVLLKRTLPNYRLDTRPYVDYPSSITEHNEQMAENFDDESVTNTNSLAPRLPGSSFYTADVNDEHFESETNVFSNMYVEIFSVDDSILVQDGWSEDADDAIDDSDWESIISDKGTINIAYDGVVSDPPNDGDYINDDDDPPDGAIRWKYEIDDILYQPSIYVWERPIGEVDAVYTELGKDSKDSSGIFEYEYNNDDFSVDFEDDEGSGFRARLNMQVVYGVKYEEYVYDYDDCPADTSGENESYDDVLSGDEEDCSSPDDEYHDESGSEWKDYENARDDHESEYPPADEVSNDAVECVQYSSKDLIYDNENCESNSNILSVKTSDFYIVKNATSNYKDDGATNADSFEIYNGYLGSYNTKSSVEKDPGTFWTGMKSKSILNRSTKFLDAGETDKFNYDVPTVEGKRGKLEASEDTNTIEGTDIEIPESYGYEKEEAISGEIKDDMNVSISLYSSGPITPSDSVELSVNDNTILDRTSMNIDNSGVKLFEPIEKNINITEDVVGSKTINITIDHSGEDRESNIRFDYIVKIDTNSTISTVDSRWRYMSYRDSRWDILYEFDSSCTSENCFDYSTHGGYIADGDSRGFSGSSPPDKIDPMYPTTGHPVKLYLVPTSSSIDSNIHNQNSNVNPKNSLSEYEREDIVDMAGREFDIVFGLSGSETEQVLNEIDGIEPRIANIPIKSEYCPRNTIIEVNYCGAESGEIASFEEEWKYTQRSTIDEEDIEENAEAIANSDEYEYDSIDDATDGVKETDNEFVTQYDPSKYYEYANFDTVKDDDTNYYPEYTKFSIDDEKNTGGWEVSGEASWISEDIPSDSVNDVLFDGVQVRAENIEDISEYITEDRRSELKDQSADHEFIDESPYDGYEEHKSNMTQIKFTVVDQFGDPIDFGARKDNSLSHTIDLDKSQYSEATGWTSKEHELNNNGVVYAVINDSRQNTNVEFIGDDSDDEWKSHSGNKRLLYSSDEPVNKLYEEEKEGEVTLSDRIRVFIIIFFGLVVILSMTFRIYPESKLSIMKLLGIALDPFKEAFSNMFEGLMYLFIIVFLLMAYSAGTGQNPLSLIESILSSIF